MFRFEVSDKLCDDEVRIRTEVFVEEQGFVVEFDQDDDVSLHIVMYDDGKAVAVCRLIPDDGGRSGSLGRLAVVRSHRGSGLGRIMVEEAESVAIYQGWMELHLSAQTRARGFYESCGYTAYGDEYMDEWCPHIMMRKILGDRSGTSPQGGIHRTLPSFRSGRCIDPGSTCGICPGASRRERVRSRRSP